MPEGFKNMYTRENESGGWSFKQELQDNHSPQQQQPTDDQQLNLSHRTT